MAEKLSRRRILVAGFGAAALTAAGHPLSRAEPALLDAPAGIEGEIADLERSYDALVGLYAVNLQTGRTLAHRDNDLFATCSAFKAYVAGQVLRKEQRGELRLTDTLYVNPAVFIPVASPITGPRLGSAMPLSDLCAAAVRQSDNTATNLLLSMLGGPASVTEFARSIGDDRTWMVRWEPDLNTAYPGDPRDTTTPRAMGDGFRAMLTGDVFDEPRRIRINEWMGSIVTGDSRIRAGLPPGWTVADKTGSGDYASTNDIGIASGPDGQRIQLAVMTRTRSADPKAAPLDALIADTTRIAVPWLLG
ncbi:MAG: class A beta-lactamase [Mycobacterium sp.]